MGDSYITIIKGEIKYLLMLKKATQCIKSWGCKLDVNWMIRVNCTYFVFWETFKYFCSFLSAVPNEKNMIFKQNKKNLHIIILFKSLHPLGLNVLCCLLEHQ